MVAMIFAWTWLKKNYLIPDSSFIAIASVFITVTLWFLGAIFLFAFLSAVIPWLTLLFTKKSQGITIEIKTSASENTIDKHPLLITIRPVFTPAFGNILLRLRYESNSLSEKFTLSGSQQNGKWFSKTLSGYYEWRLPDIKEYAITSAIIYFEDMFHFFSFASVLTTETSFITHPVEVADAPLNVKPKKSHDTQVRIDRIRKVEGEFINYKNFEDNDDIRRIVWKIYAKNKELVIRVPEINEPYASHIYFYASFYNTLKFTNYYPAFERIFLNHFKTITWNCYNQLSRQNQLISYIPDQETKPFFSDDPDEKVKQIISTAEWHSGKNVQQYFNTHEGSLLCISSFTDAADLQNMLESAEKDTVIVFIQHSRILSGFKYSDWIEWLFVNPAKDSIDRLKFKWNFSPLKKNILSNEKIISKILYDSEVEKMIL
jgi:hypothetical protein